MRLRILIAVAALATALPCAAQAPPPQPAEATTAGRFYVVQANGALRAEDPVRSGFAIGADPRLSGERDPTQKVRVSGKPPAAPPRSAVAVRRQPPPERDASEAFRCERIGLYYTQDGRCVMPATADFQRPGPPSGAGQPGR